MKELLLTYDFSFTHIHLLTYWSQFLTDIQHDFALIDVRWSRKLCLLFEKMAHNRELFSNDMWPEYSISMWTMTNTGIPDTELFNLSNEYRYSSGHWTWRTLVFFKFCIRFVELDESAELTKTSQAWLKVTERFSVCSTHSWLRLVKMPGFWSVGCGFKLRKDFFYYKFIYVF